MGLEGHDATEEVTAADLKILLIKGDPLNETCPLYAGQTLHVWNFLMINELVFFLGNFEFSIHNIVGVH